MYQELINSTPGGGSGQSARRHRLLSLSEKQKRLRGRHQQCELRAREYGDRDQHVHSARSEKLHRGTQQTFEVRSEELSILS